MNRRTFLRATGGAALLTGLTATGCGTGGSSGDLRVAASSVPHAEILRHISESGVLKDTRLKISEISGDLDANQLLVGGDIDANYFQHVPYADDWAKQHGGVSFAHVAKVHVEPLGLYSRRAKAPTDLPQGGTVVLPDDVTNFARGLFLLADAGLLTLDVARGGAAIDVTERNITGNPKGLKIVGIDDAQLPRTLDDPTIAGAVINGNYALEARLTPAKDALRLEPKENNPYANVLTVLGDKAGDPRVKALATALTSPETADWITQRYSGSVLPVAQTPAGAR
ncbi:MetQ/NlpA family ABC transporter substrate-binding protein [Mariniluteicoccus endophyticus]